MKPSFVIYLLLLSLFLIQARGIRLEKGSQQHKQHDEENNLLKRIDSAAKKEATLCEDEQYSAGKRKCRKLVTSSISTNQDISKNVKNEGNETEAPETYKSRNYKVNWEGKEIFVNKQEEVSDEKYMELVEIAGMDYSPAKKNPPIHN
ncbi:uncharacterized protein LOC114164789 [Vigna unguiculata]|uniref:uncharacterized protein LOC114164789 n=1 Tax=Vigna unguiculata TaxID=3917 RepID=UPI001016E2CF|nr:uncharacterized protein LOC114164789 [Vigna unguiculata]